MKAIRISLVLLFLNFGVRAQDIMDFMVLHADGATVSGVTLNSFTLLDSGDVVKSKGLLILVHRTGKFISFEKKATLKIAELNRSILQELKMQSCDNVWPSIEILFSNGRRNRLTGAVSARIEEMEWLVPDNNSMANPNQTLGMLWRPIRDGIKSYQLQVNNIFDEPIGDSWNTMEDRQILRLDTIKELEIPVVIINIWDPASKYRQVEGMGIKLVDSKYAMPDTFEATTAVKALEIGFYLEEYQLCQYALPYFEKAVELSDNPFYKEMLDKHRARCVYRR